VPITTRPPKRSAPALIAVFFAVFIFGAISVFAAVGNFVAGFLEDPNPFGTVYPWERDFPEPWVSDNQTFEPAPAELPPEVAVPGVPDPDFDAPGLPYPDTIRQAKSYVNDNPLYLQSVAPLSDCPVSLIDASKATTAELETQFNKLAGCLWQVWSPPVQAASFEMPRPPVTVYTKPITTACGKIDEANALYCAADQRIYYAKALTGDLPKKLRAKPFIAETILAHEFGHAVQARTGILLGAAVLETDMTAAQEQLSSRRSEMQADCFAGLFTHSASNATGLTPSDKAALSDLIYSLGDDILTGEAGYSGDHGTGKNRKAWYDLGKETTAVGTCNTFAADKGKVK
jgi:predicted metalloprotease